MKVLVVLALAIFTGSHANLFYADEPKPQLEVWTDAFWDDVAKAAKIAADTLNMISETPLGQQVFDHLSNIWAGNYVIALQEKLPIPPMALDLMTKISRAAEVLRDSLTQALLAPITEGLKDLINSVEDLQAGFTTLHQSLTNGN